MIEHYETLGIGTDAINELISIIIAENSTQIDSISGATMPFPIIADHDLVVSELYGMLNPDRMYEETVRDLFIIDPAGKIAAIITYPASTGRNSEEIIRVLDSLQIYEQYKLKTPANWKQGEPVVLDNVRSNEELINRMNNKEALGYYCPFWYLCFTNIPAENTEEA